MHSFDMHSGAPSAGTREILQRKESCRGFWACDWGEHLSGSNFHMGGRRGGLCKATIVSPWDSAHSPFYVNVNGLLSSWRCRLPLKSLVTLLRSLFQEKPSFWFMLSKSIHGVLTVWQQHGRLWRRNRDDWYIVPVLEQPTPLYTSLYTSLWFLQRVFIEHLLDVRHVCSCDQDGQSEVTVNQETACEKAWQLWWQESARLHGSAD